MKYTVIMLLLLPCWGFSQTIKVLNGKEFVVTPMDSAARIAFWGEKGIASLPLTKHLQSKVESLELELRINETVRMNFKEAIAESRTNIENCAKENHNLSLEVNKLGDNRDLWKDRARQRGTENWIWRGLAAIAAYVGITSIIGI